MKFDVNLLTSLQNEKSCIQVVEKASAVATEMRAELWLVSSKTASPVASGIDDLFSRMAAISFDSIMVKHSRDWHLNARARQIGPTEAISMIFSKLSLQLVAFPTTLPKPMRLFPELSSPSNPVDVLPRGKFAASCSATHGCKYL